MREMKKGVIESGGFGGGRGGEVEEMGKKIGERRKGSMGCVGEIGSEVGKRGK